MEKYKASKNQDDNIEEKSQEERNVDNFKNNLDNVAEVADASGNPYAVAAAKAYKLADKFTGGQSSKMLAEGVNKATKMSPIGNQITNASNAISESGMSDAIGGAASIKNGNLNSSNVSSNTSNSTNSSSNGFLTSNIMSFGFSKSLKIKIAIGVGVCFFLVMTITTIASGKDFVNLETTNNSTMVSKSSMGSVDSSYISGGSGTMMSGESLLAKLGQEKIDAWNSKIQSDVASGIGTGDGPAVAAYDLIQGALDEGIVLPYLWGGGHGAITTGVNPNWGASTKVTFSGSSRQPVGSYFPDGLDCSGFVSWALRNGGCSSFSVMSSGSFVSLGPAISATQAKVGDIPANSSHVMIVIENTGSSLVVAEALGTDYGIVFSEYSYDYFNRYTVVDMSGYYATNCMG